MIENQETKTNQTAAGEVLPTAACSPVYLTDAERIQISDILRGDANVIAKYYDDHRESMPHRVNQGTQREMRRLRRLAEKVKLPELEENFNDEHDN